MKYNFCTLFDTYYFARGLALYESLQRNGDNFHLYVFAFDENVYSFFQENDFDNLTVISLKEFENDQLLNVKKNRTIAEYCWTCTGATIQYCIEMFSLDHCTYLDADLYFYANPKVLLDEVADGKVLITEHRYTKRYDQSKSSGKYCVQFMTFHNNAESMTVLKDWIGDCINWCYARAEDGKFGDQKYLDYWVTKYNCIHELKHLGGGLAPWNIQQYDVKLQNNQIVGSEKMKDNIFTVVFYHFHALKFLGDDLVNLAPYELNKNIIDLIYKPYLNHILEVEKKYQRYLKTNQQHSSKNKLTFKYILKRIFSDKGLLVRVFKQKILETNNIYKIQEIKGKS